MDPILVTLNIKKPTIKTHTKKKKQGKTNNNNNKDVICSYLLSEVVIFISEYFNFSL